MFERIDEDNLASRNFRVVGPDETASNRLDALFDVTGRAFMGVDPRPLGLFLDRWMVRFRKHGRFVDRLAG